MALPLGAWSEQPAGRRRGRAAAGRRRHGKDAVEAADALRDAAGAGNAQLGAGAAATLALPEGDADRDQRRLRWAKEAFREIHQSYPDDPVLTLVKTLHLQVK